MSPCPSRDELLRFAVGELEDAACAALAAHVRDCAACRSLLDGLTAFEVHSRAVEGGLTEPLATVRLGPRPRLHRTIQEPSLPLATTEPPEPASSSASPRLSMPGYRILEEVGRGGMGVVYKAYQLGLGRLVALKVVLAGPWADGQRIRREAEAAARLRHPHVIGVYQIGEQEGRAFLALEYAEGGNLSRKLAGKPQPPREAAQMLEVLAGAVACAHEAGIIHRDLKPSNVLLTADGTPKIADFGLAKWLHAESGATRTGAILGTPSYMAPEQAAGKSREIGPAVDVWALGAILYEMLTGRPPFQGETTLDTLQNVQTVEPIPPRRLRPKLPRDLETICLRCLEKDPKRRYPSARAVAEDAARFREGRPILARPVGTAERLWRWCQRNPRLAALEVGLVLLLLIIAVGASLMAVWQREQRLRQVRDAEALHEQRSRAERAEAQARADRFNAYLGSVARARAARTSLRPGQRLASLEALTEAAGLAPSLDLSPDPLCQLRGEAVAALALVDLRPWRRWHMGPPEAAPDKPGALGLDNQLERWIATDPSGTLHLHRVTDNQEVSPPLPGPGQPAWRAQFSPEGRFVAVLHHDTQGGPWSVRLWDLHSAEAIRHGPRARAAATCCDFSPDGKQWALGLQEGGVVIEDTATGKELYRIRAADVSPFRLTWPPARPEGRAPFRVAWSPRGSRLAVIGWRGSRVHIVDLDRRQEVTALDLPDYVFGAGWAPDGIHLATACADFNVYIWNSTTGQKLTTLTGHQAEAIDVAFSRGGELLASTGWDSTLRLWDPWTGKELLSHGGIGVPRFGPEDTRLGFLSSRTAVEVGDLIRTPEFRTLAGHEGYKSPVCVDFSPDGRWLASAGSDGVRLWDAITGRELAGLAAGDCGGVAFQPDRRGLWTSGESGLCQWPLVDPAKAGGRLQIGPPRKLVVHSGLYRLARSRDGRTLAACGFSGPAVLYREQHGGRPLWLRDHPSAGFLALSPAGNTLAAGAWHGAGIKVWDVATARVVTDLHSTDAQVAFSPDGRLLAAGTEGEYRSWRTDTWEPGGLRLAREQLSVPGPLAFSPDGRMLAIAPTAHKVRLVDPANGREYVTLTAPQPEPITWFCFSPDGARLAVACASHVIHLWDLRRLRQELAHRGLDWDSPPSPLSP